MSSSETSDIASQTRDGQFPSTRWSLVQAVIADDTKTAVALAELCRIYWYPLYVFARRSGLSVADAEDATQGFLARVIEKDYIARARSELGTLRSFLLRGLKNYLANERKARHRLKRGGNQETLSLDFLTAEKRYQQEPVEAAQTPDYLFERRWATTVLESVFATLKHEYMARDKSAIYEALKSSLGGTRSGAQTYANVASDLAMTEGAVKLAAYRMRQRFREILRMQVAQTVHSEEEVNEEILALFRAFSR